MPNSSKHLDLSTSSFEGRKHRFRSGLHILKSRLEAGFVDSLFALAVWILYLFEALILRLWNCCFGIILVFQRGLAVSWSSRLAVLISFWSLDVFTWSR